MQKPAQFKTLHDSQESAEKNPKNMRITRGPLHLITAEPVRQDTSACEPGVAIGFHRSTLESYPIQCCQRCQNSETTQESPRRVSGHRENVWRKGPSFLPQTTAKVNSTTGFRIRKRRHSCRPTNFAIFCLFLSLLKQLCLLPLWNSVCFQI